MILVTIQQNNEAFGKTTHERNVETARILRELAAQIEKTGLMIQGTKLYDANGENVGLAKEC